MNNLDDLNDLTKPTRVWDRSRTSCDWKCPRARYFNYEYNGKGIVPNSSHIALFLGNVLHTGLAQIAQGEKSGFVNIGVIAELARRDVVEELMKNGNGTEEDLNFANEQACLLEGLLRGFNKVVWPTIMENCAEILFIEEEMNYFHDSMVFMSKPDLVIKTKDDNVIYYEYKSTGFKNDKWINSWSTAVQLHSTIKAVEFEKNVKIDQVNIIGLYKGYAAGSGDFKKQTSPLCYGYVRNAQPPFLPGSISYEWKAGTRKVPVWEMEGGVKEWVDNMPLNILQDQFPQVPPIMIKEDLINTFFTQRTWREKEIGLALEMYNACSGDVESQNAILDVTFPQKFEQCKPAFGFQCDYVKLCHGFIPDPLSSGFEIRESHHQLENEIWKENENANQPSTED